jgi:hypothetical protein
MIDSVVEPLLVDGFERRAARGSPDSQTENCELRPSPAKHTSSEAPEEAEKNRFSSLPQRKESRRAGPDRRI